MPADYGAGTKPELFDLVIFDAALPAELPADADPGDRPAGDEPARDRHRDAEGPGARAARPRRAAPALRGPHDAPRRPATRLALPAWARTVVPPAARPSSTPGSAGAAAAVLAFEPRRSDLPLQVAFPILVTNLVGELVGASAAPTRPWRRASP